MLKANIKTDVHRTIDSDSVEYFVTITNRHNKVLIKDLARLLFSSNSFHLNDSLDVKCERVGIVPFDLQTALESRSDVVKMAKLKRYYQPFDGIMKELKIPKNHIWETSESCASDLDIDSRNVVPHFGDYIEDPIFVDGTLDVRSLHCNISTPKNLELSVDITQEQYLSTKKYFMFGGTETEDSTFLVLEVKQPDVDILHTLTLAKDRFNPGEGKDVLTGTHKVEEPGEEPVFIKETFQDMESCYELVKAIMYETRFKLAENFSIKPDLRKVVKNSGIRVAIDVHYEIMSLFNAGETPESMGSYIKNVLQAEIKAGLLTGKNCHVEVDNSQVYLSTDSVECF